MPLTAGRWASRPSLDDLVVNATHGVLARCQSFRTAETFRKSTGIILVVRRAADYATVETVNAVGREPASFPQESSTWLDTTVKFTINEATGGRPGNAAMLGRLTEIMFVEIVREYMHQLNPRERGWLARRAVRTGNRCPHFSVR